MPLTVDFPPLRIGVAGLGRTGMFHIERIGLGDDCRVVALYDDCQAALERAGSPMSRASWGDFLRDDEIELVLLATPPAVHAEQAIEALVAGRHVVVESPLCLNLAEADAIIAASQRAGRSVSVAHTRRGGDDFRTACQALAGGILGRPLAIKLINWHYNPFRRGRAATGGPRPTPTPDPTGRPLDLARVDWRDHASTGGGVLWEFGTHYFDQLLQLAGRPAESVFARIDPSPHAAVDDGFLAVINFAEGLVGHIEVNRAAAAPLCTGWTVAGDAGSYAGFTEYTTTLQGEVVDVPLAPVSAGSDEFYGNIVRHIRQGGPNPVSAAAARCTIALVEAVRKSARCGQVVPVETT